jgi:MFS family permease
MNVLNLLAPGIAGFIIGDTSNFKAVYFTMAALYILAVLFFLFIPKRNRLTAVRSNIMADIQKGFQYIRKDSLILLVLVFTLIVVVLSMPYQQLMPIFVDDILKVGATGMGLLLSVSGAGALIGSLILAVLPNKKRGVMLLFSGIVSGIALVIFSFSSYLYLSLIFIFFLGLGQTFRMTIGSALLQAYTQDVYMGRVMSILNMQWGFMSLCTFFAGIIAERVDVQWVLGSLAILLIILSFGFILFASNIRKVN